jgi:serine/threonine protein kinase
MPILYYSFCVKFFIEDECAEIGKMFIFLIIILEIIEIDDIYTNASAVGGYGSVFRGCYTENNKQILVAVKLICPKNPSEGIDGTTLREVSILRNLPPHDNIVKFLDLIPQNDSTHGHCIVFPYYFLLIYLHFLILNYSI